MDIAKFVQSMGSVSQSDCSLDDHAVTVQASQDLYPLSRLVFPAQVA
jgi:hypothetical protein